MNPTELFYLLLKASLLSTGGFGNLPALHHDLVTLRRWATEEQLAAALAVGQVSPGPNGIWAVCFGFLIDGWRGAALATIAIALPPFLILPLQKLIGDRTDHPAAVGFLRGLSLAVVGLMSVTMGRLLYSAGFTLPTFALFLFGIIAALSKRVPVVLALALAAGFGILLYNR